MKQLRISLENPDDYIDPYDPLTDYAYQFAEKIKPRGESEWEEGFPYSKIYIVFNRRYLEKNVDTKFINDYENDEVLKDIITTLGYDLEKFWYLLLLINDYSYCACKRETEFFKSALECFEDICKYIGEDGAELTLRVKGKKKVEITERTTLDLIKRAVNDLMHIDTGRCLSALYPKYGKFSIVKENSDSYTIWYFATLFLMFFELIPPKKIRRKKDGFNSYSKKHLISRLIYLVGLSTNESFLDSEYTINGFLRQYKNSSIYEKMVLDYW